MFVLRIAAILIFILTGAAAAQQVDRATLFRDVLTAATLDEASRLAEYWKREAQGLRGAADLVESLAAFRRFQLDGNDTDAKRAESLAGRARSTAPGDAWMHYAYALVVAHGPDVQSNGTVLRATGRSWAKELGLDARARARRAAERALELDSLHSGAAVIYGEIAMQTLEDAHLRRARSALERVSAAAESAPVAVTLARILEQAGDGEAAVQAVERAVEEDPSDAAVEYVYARALLQTPGEESKGARHYFSAIASMTPELGDRVYEELRPIATAGDGVRWQQASLEGRREWIRKFWEVHAAMSTVTVAERLAEHYRRLAFALKEYPRNYGGPVPQKELLQERNTLPVDQRGQLYIRHGEPWRKIPVQPQMVPARDILPACEVLSADLGGEAWRAYASDQNDRRIRSTQPRRYWSPQAEMWVYLDAHGTTVYPLIRCGNLPDYMMTYDLPCTLIERVEGIPAPDPAIAQQSFDIAACGDRTPERRRVLAREALRTDTQYPPLETRIPLYFDLLAFRGAGGRTDLLAPIALAVDSLRAERRMGGFRYAVRLLASVTDTAAQRVEQTDTTRAVLSMQPLRQGDWWNVHTELSATPTAHAFFRLRVQNQSAPTHGALLAQDVRIPSYVGDTLMISDLVLGPAVEGGNFVRGGRRIAVMPFARFDDGRFHVFYEIYNLSPGAYRTELIVQSRTDPAARPLRLLFEDEASPDADGVVRVLRSVDTELPPGRYRMAIRIFGGSQGSREKIRDFVIGS